MAMKTKSIIVLTITVVMCFVVYTPKAKAYNVISVPEALSCGGVAPNLLPCTGYFLFGGDHPPMSCCEGLRNLNLIYDTTLARQGACRCVQALLARAYGVNPEYAAAVTDKCHVDIGYPISYQADCDRVHI